MDHRDRELILRRRARFVGSTLLALAGCGASQTPGAAANASPSPVNVPAPSASATEAGPVPTQPEPAASELPTLVVPEEATGIARSVFESLARIVPELHAELDALGRDAPAACDLDDSGCRRGWSDVSTRLGALARRFAALTPKCPGESDLGKLYSERVELHIAFGNRRVAELDRRFEQEFAASGDAALSKWRELRNRSVGAEPRACLDCASW